MAAWSFRVTFIPGQQPQLDEVDPLTPAGVYQVSGFDNRADASASEQISVSVVQHGTDGKAIVGASGYLGA